MIIGINGKIGSGKDTVGKIIQYLVANKNLPKNMQYHSLEELDNGVELYSNWKVKKFAGKLKTVASLLTGIPVEKFEDQDFKMTELGPEWARPFYDKDGNIHYETITVRKFLQLLGTESMRMGLHVNTWVNALFADYNPVAKLKGADILPNWCITDMRFPNEMEAVVKRNGITIRVIRSFNHKMRSKETGTLDLTPLHPSETALDDAEFDYEIMNDGTIEDLVEKVREILIKENII